MRVRLHLDGFEDRWVPTAPVATAAEAADVVSASVVIDTSSLDPMVTQLQIRITTDDGVVHTITVNIPQLSTHSGQVSAIAEALRDAGFEVQLAEGGTRVTVTAGDSDPQIDSVNVSTTGYGRRVVTPANPNPVAEPMPDDNAVMMPIITGTGGVEVSTNINLPAGF